MESLNTVLENLTCRTINNEPPKRLKKTHLSTIEKTKEYILKNFTQNISLAELAKYCCVSYFISAAHFSS